MWEKLDLHYGVHPQPRVYHSAALCKIGTLSGMIIFFGGRASQNKNEICLNDAWGLRRDKLDRWEWIKAPIKNDYQDK